MTTSYAVPFSSRGADAALMQTVIPAAEFATGVRTADGNETSYKHLEGNPALPTTLRVGTYPPAKTGSPTNRSVRLATTGVKTDGDGNESTFPYVVTVAESDGSHGQADPEVRAAMIMMAVSVLLRGAGLDDEASTNVLNRLSFGENDILHVVHA